MTLEGERLLELHSSVSGASGMSHQRIRMGENTCNPYGFNEAVYRLSLLKYKYNSLYFSERSYSFSDFLYVVKCVPQDNRHYISFFLNENEI